MKTKPKDQAFQIHHERCECGHCRCEHAGITGHLGCSAAKCDCIRYTWPGADADLPANHPRSGS
jgi:hypothetical protein